MTTLRSIVAATDFSPASDAVVHRAAKLAATHRVSLCLLLAFDIGAWQILKGALCGVGPPPKVINAYVDSHAGALVVIGSRVEPALSGRSTTALRTFQKSKIRRREGLKGLPSYIRTVGAGLHRT